MKRRSDKISKIIALETVEEQRHGAATGRSRQHLDDQLARLGELNAYRQSYADLSRSQKGLSSAHLKDFQRFIARLDQAVLSQQQVVRDSEQNLEMHRRRWLAKRQRLDSLKRVLDRYTEEEAQFLERQQQRAQDDLPLPEHPYAQDDGEEQ